MPPTPPQIVSTQDLSDLFRSYQAAFGPIAEMPDPIEEELARIISGEGQQVRIPFSPVANPPKTRENDDERGSTGIEEYYCTIDHRLIYPDSSRVLYDTIMSSRLQFQLFADNLAEMLQTAPGIWRELLASTMDLARTARGAAAQLKSYNGQSFFSTAHPINPTKTALGIQANYLPKTLMDKKGATAAVKLIDNMKGHDGRRINRKMRSLVCVVPNEDLRVRASEVFTAETIAQAIGANAGAAIPNQLQKVGVKVVKLPELSDYSDKASYLLDLTSPTARAFMVSKVRQVTPYYTGLLPEDEVRRKHLSVEAGYDAFGGAGVALHQKAVCIEEP